MIIYKSNIDKSSVKETYTYLAIRTITLIGSLAIVKMNKANGSPKAIKVQPKNSIKVMISVFLLEK